MPYPRNRPNKSSFFIGYQPAGNIDPNPIWKLANAKISLRDRSPKAAIPENKNLDVKGLPIDLAPVESDFNRSMGMYRSALQKYGDYYLAKNSKEWREAEMLSTVGITERADLEKELKHWGADSEFDKLKRENPGHAYLPSGAQSFSLDKNGNIVNLNTVYDTRMSTSLRDMRRSGSYISPHSSAYTAENANKYLRDVFGKASSNEFSREDFNPADMGLFEYYRTSVTNSGNKAQLQAAMNNMIQSLPDDVNDGLFQEYAQSGAHDAFLSDFDGKKDIREATWENFSKWRAQRIASIANEFRRNKFEMDFAKIETGLGGTDGQDLYRNWMGFLNSDVPVAQMKESDIGISIPKGDGTFDYFRLPSQELAGGSYWYGDAMSQLPKVNIGTKEKPLDVVLAKDLFSGTRVMINSNDGLVTNNIDSDILEKAYVISVGSGQRAFPKPLIEKLRSFNGQQISQRDIPRIARELAGANGPISAKSAASLDPRIRENINILQAALPIYEASGRNVDDMPHSFVNVDLILPSDQSFTPWAEDITNHPWLEPNESRVPHGQDPIGGLKRGGKLAGVLKMGEGSLLSESISPFSSVGGPNDRSMQSSDLWKMSERISDDIGKNVAVFRVLIGVRNEDEMLPRNDPDKKQGQAERIHAEQARRNGQVVGTQNTVNVYNSIAR